MCPEDECDIVSDVESKVSALNDHDYVPAAKRARSDMAHVKDYCLPLLDDHYTPPPVKMKQEAGYGSLGEDTGGGAKRIKLETEEAPDPIEEEPVAMEVESKVPDGVIKTMLRRLEENLTNWTDTEDKNPPVLPPSVVVQLAASGSRFHEDIELE